MRDLSKFIWLKLVQLISIQLGLNTWNTRCYRASFSAAIASDCHVWVPAGIIVNILQAKCHEPQRRCGSTVNRVGKYLFSLGTWPSSSGCAGLSGWTPETSGLCSSSAWMSDLKHTRTHKTAITPSLKSLILQHDNKADFQSWTNGTEGRWKVIFGFQMGINDLKIVAVGDF